MVWKCQSIQPTSHYEYLSCLPHFAQIVLQWIEMFICTFISICLVYICHPLHFAFIICFVLPLFHIDHRVENCFVIQFTTGLPGWLSSKASACNEGDAGSIPESGRSSGWEQGHPLRYSCQENPMDRGDWWATVDRVAKSQTRWKWHSTHTCNSQLLYYFRA